MDTIFKDFKFLCLTIYISATSAKFTSGFISKTIFNGVVVPVKKEYGGVADLNTFMDSSPTSAVKFFENVIYIDTLYFPTNYEPGIVVIEGRN